MALFVEKPIDASTERLDDLLDRIEKKNLATYVGYVLRFHPVVQALRELLLNEDLLHARVTCTSYLPDWREGENHREVYSARREMGGGAILDLSHEFDLVDFLFGPVESISGRFGRLSRVTVDAEDYVDAEVRCRKARVNLHLNLFSRRRERRISVDTPNATYEGDLLSGRLRCESKDENWEKTLDSAMDDPYRRQLDFFLTNLSNPRMMNNLKEASPLFRKLIAFREQRSA